MLLHDLAIPMHLGEEDMHVLVGRDKRPPSHHSNVSAHKHLRPLQDGFAEK